MTRKEKESVETMNNQQSKQEWIMTRYLRLEGKVKKEILKKMYRFETYLTSEVFPMIGTPRTRGHKFIEREERV